MKKIYLSILLLLLSIGTNVYSQDETKEVYKEIFYINNAVFYPYDSAGGRVDVYIEISLGGLQFKYANDIYSAPIEYNINIKNNRGEVIVDKSYNETITNSKSEQKHIAEKSISTVKSYYLPSDNYTMTYTLKDVNINAEYTKDYNFTVKNTLNDTFTISDILLLSNFTINSDGVKEITPLINLNIGNLEKFYLFFEIYNRGSETSKFYRIKFSDNKQKTVFDTTVNINLRQGNNTIVIPNYTSKFYIGDFRIDFYDTGSEPIASKQFIYRWVDIPVNIKDIDKAISQLLFIATTDELDYIKDGKTKDERLKRFMQFWKKLDPSPNSVKNETMIEYYGRIKIANERYSHYTEGWKTDMGMVYIIYGNPGNIERHPFDSDSKPYEIWTYYDINRQFVFVDNTGFGDYRLQTPIWDDRTRIRGNF